MIRETATSVPRLRLRLRLRPAIGGGWLRVRKPRKGGSLNSLNLQKMFKWGRVLAAVTAWDPAETAVIIVDMWNKHWYEREHPPMLPPPTTHHHTHTTHTPHTTRHTPHTTTHHHTPPHTTTHHSPPSTIHHPPSTIHHPGALAPPPVSASLRYRCRPLFPPSATRAAQ